MMTSLYHSLYSLARGVIFSAWASSRGSSARSGGGPLDAFETLARPLVAHVAGVERRGRLEQHDLDLLIRHRAVLHAVRHDEEFALGDVHRAILVLHPEPPLHHVEQLVLVVVMVPDERPL